ncbi:hypothetical protein D3C87_1934850 [compost metagenome]
MIEQFGSRPCTEADQRFIDHIGNSIFQNALVHRRIFVSKAVIVVHLCNKAAIISLKELKLHPVSEVRCPMGRDLPLDQLVEELFAYPVFILLHRHI